MHQITKDEAQQMLMQYSNSDNNGQAEVTKIVGKRNTSTKRRMTAAKLNNDLISSHKTKMGMSISAIPHIIPLKVAPSPSCITDHSVASSSSSDNTVRLGNVLSCANNVLYQSNYEDDSIHYRRYPSFDQSFNFHTHSSSSGVNSDTNASDNIFGSSGNVYRPQNTSPIFSIASLLGTSQSPSIAVPLTSPILPTDTATCVPQSVMSHFSNATSSPDGTYVGPDLLPPITAQPQSLNVLTDITNERSSTASSSPVGVSVCPDIFQPTTANPQALNSDITMRNIDDASIPQFDPDNNTDKDAENNEIILSTGGSDEESVATNIISPSKILNQLQQSIQV